MEKDIGKINKGEYQGTTTDIVVAIREYNGRVGIDIREHVTSDRYTGPTKKGLRIPAERFAEFKDMINSINESDLQTQDSDNSSESQQQGQSTLKEESEEIKTEKPGQNSSESNKGSEELPDY